MMPTDDSRKKKMRIAHKRNSRTRITVTRMDMNAPPTMTVLIACTQKRATNHVRRGRTQWAVVCYTNDYGNSIVLNAPEGVGQEKGVVKQVSFIKITSS